MLLLLMWASSKSDKAIVEIVKSGVLEHFKPGDLILAEKGFLIADIVPTGVPVNITPFLYNRKFNESFANQDYFTVQIHVERASVYLKD